MSDFHLGLKGCQDQGLLGEASAGIESGYPVKLLGGIEVGAS